MTKQTMMWDIDFHSSEGKCKENIYNKLHVNVSIALLIATNNVNNKINHIKAMKKIKLHRFSTLIQ